ncbi:unnamed protein product [Acanthosepion pharaonis]|uniref:Uncharacterized protein n=1 Tax=Acanthosepion pharaonis TaxID=158019 RepID=A0A812B6W4_ACAPH|nr:unnamed protein product [Sepia pharaonis]
MLGHLLLSTERSALQIYHTIAFIQPVRLSWRAFPSVNVDGALLFESRLLIGDRLLITFAHRHLQPPIFYESESLNFSFLLNFCRFFFSSLKLVVQFSLLISKFSSLKEIFSRLTAILSFQTFISFPPLPIPFPPPRFTLPFYFYLFPILPPPTSSLLQALFSLPTPDYLPFLISPSFLFPFVVSLSLRQLLLLLLILHFSFHLFSSHTTTLSELLPPTHSKSASCLNIFSPSFFILLPLFLQLPHYETSPTGYILPHFLFPPPYCSLSLPLFALFSLRQYLLSLFKLSFLSFQSINFSPLSKPFSSYSYSNSFSSPPPPFVFPSIGSWPLILYSNFLSLHLFLPPPFLLVFFLSFFPPLLILFHRVTTFLSLPPISLFISKSFYPDETFLSPVEPLFFLSQTTYPLHITFPLQFFFYPFVTSISPPPQIQPFSIYFTIFPLLQFHFCPVVTFFFSPPSLKPATADSPSRFQYLLLSLFYQVVTFFFPFLSRCFHLPSTTFSFYPVVTPPPSFLLPL